MAWGKHKNETIQKATRTRAALRKRIARALKRVAKTVQRFASAAAKRSRRVERIRQTLGQERRKSQRVKGIRKSRKPKRLRQTQKKKAPRQEITSRNGFRKRFKKLSRDRIQIEYWSRLEFNPPAPEETAELTVNEWLKVRSKPAAERWFNNNAPNIPPYARVFVQCEFYTLQGDRREMWVSAALRVPLSQLSFEIVSDLLTQVENYGVSVQANIMKIEIAYTSQPMTKEFYAHAIRQTPTEPA